MSVICYINVLYKYKCQDDILALQLVQSYKTNTITLMFRMVNMTFMDMSRESNCVKFTQFFILLAIYTYKALVSQSVRMSLFPSPQLFVPGGQTFLTHRRGGDKHLSHPGGTGGTNIFHTQGGGTNIFCWMQWWL